MTPTAGLGVDNNTPNTALYTLGKLLVSERSDSITLLWMSTTTETTMRQRGPQSGLGGRDLGLARAAYSCGDDNLSRQLSREAHGLLSESSTSPTGDGTPPSFTSWAAGVAEAGHNEELAHRGATLILRGAVDGVMLSIAVLSLGDAASWPASTACSLNASLLVCWSLYCMCREGLEMLTYKAHYKRERQREAWGVLSHDHISPCLANPLASLMLPHDACTFTTPQSWTTFRRARSRRWCSCTPHAGCPRPPHAASSALSPASRPSLST